MGRSMRGFGNFQKCTESNQRNKKEGTKKWKNISGLSIGVIPVWRYLLK